MIPWNIIIGVMFCAFGLGLVALYIVVARRRFGVHIDPVQSVLYRLDTSKFSAGDRVLEFFLRMLKHFGFLLAVFSGVIVFAGK